MKVVVALATILSALPLATSGQTSATVKNLNLHPLKAQPFETGLLPGQFQIEFASARPAARAYFLLYAAALDQFASEKAALLTKEPVLGRMVRQQYTETLAIFTNYASRMSGHYFPIVSAAGEAQDLRIFLKSGYTGQLKGQIDDYLAELDKARQAKQ